MARLMLCLASVASTIEQDGFYIYDSVDDSSCVDGAGTAT